MPPTIHYRTTPQPPESRQGHVITKAGSSLPAEPASLAAERAKKGDQLRATLRPEIAAMAIATKNIALARVLSEICDQYEQSTRVPPYSELHEPQLEHMGLIEEVKDDFGRLGSRPSQTVLAAMAKAKAKKVSARKDDRRATFGPGSLMGLRRNL